LAQRTGVREETKEIARTQVPPQGRDTKLGVWVYPTNNREPMKIVEWYSAEKYSYLKPKGLGIGIISGTEPLGLDSHWIPHQWDLKPWWPHLG
jgi:hypothetical protein